MPELLIQVWSDIACPWCFVGKRRLEAALAPLQGANEFRVRWRAFELDPSAPARYPDPPNYLERLANKYRMSLSQAQAMVDRMRGVGDEEGIHFDFKSICGGNTFTAHRLLCSVADDETQTALKERLFVAYFSESRCMSDLDSLASLAAEVGVDFDRASAVLHSNDYAQEVREEQRLAAQLGVHGVPFFAIGNYGISGAQPAAVLRNVIERALSELPETAKQPATGQDAAPRASACTPDGCD